MATKTYPVPTFKELTVREGREVGRGTGRGTCHQTVSSQDPDSAREGQEVNEEVLGRVLVQMREQHVQRLEVRKTGA